MKCNLSEHKSRRYFSLYARRCDDQFDFLVKIISGSLVCAQKRSCLTEGLYIYQHTKLITAL